MEEAQEQANDILVLPVLPLRDVVIFPSMVIPLFVGRNKSIAALEAAMSSNKQVFLVAQRSASEDEPGVDDIYQYGTISTVLQLLKLPDGTVKVLVEGAHRGSIVEILDTENFINASVQIEVLPPFSDRESDVLIRSVLSQFDQYVKLNKKIPQEILTSISGIEDPGRLADTIAAHISLKIEDKQQLLEAASLKERLLRLMELMEGEIDLLQVEKRIRGRVKRQMEKSQREYYLKEQMHAIQKELGELEDGVNELEEFAHRIEKAGMPQEAKQKALSELSKLKMMSPMSAEATVSRNYLDWILDTPWKKKSKVRLDLDYAQKILDEEHYGLEKVKERIIEYLAVQQRVKKIKGQVLCLVGPPGVGKTSLGSSIAKATARKFARIALGGVRDEAEIRGHRRTYIGSMPGKIIQKLSKVGVKNPLLLLDEIDKMGMDFRGDPASALLEVLDSEQNDVFNDHYLEVDYDLSEVMFITTANSLNIPGPLMDRMEIIRLPGYTEDEKAHIAMRHLLPKQIKENGLAPDEIKITEGSLRDIVRYYTREAGVRGLEREIAKICRKVVKQLLESPDLKQMTVNPRRLEKYLGVRKFRFGSVEENDQIGQVTGLAWTEVGGELLTIEVAAVSGKGKALYTGRLGDVMQESIQTALTVVRSRAYSLGLRHEFSESRDIHVHVPEGATPKDGPSAGIGMCTALVSALTEIPVRADVAMTGEITLRGEVLPIGGLKEKLLAALRGGIAHVIIPLENERDLKEIPKNIKQGLSIHPVRWIDEVFDLALVRMPEPLSEEEIAKLLAKNKKTDSSDEQPSRH